MSEFDFPYFGENEENLEEFLEKSSKEEASEPPPIPDMSYDDKLYRIEKKYKVDYFLMNRFKSHLWLKNLENLTLNDMEKEYKSWRQSECKHVWKPIQGIFKTYYNCSECDAKKEECE